MKILQKYILVELLKVFSLLLTVLTVMLVFVGIFQEAQEKGLGAVQIIQILPYIIPSLMPYTIPATLLLSVCVVYGRLAGDLEVIATKSAGINPVSLLLPAFGLGIVLSISSLVLTDQVIPWAITRMNQKISDAVEDIFLDKLRSTHLISDPTEGFTISVKNVRDRTLISPIIQYTPEDHSTITLQAETATIKFDLQNRETVLDLSNCQINTPGQNSIYIERERYAIPLDEDGPKLKPRHLSVRSIESKIAEMETEVLQDELKRDMEVAFALATGEFESLAGPQVSKASKLSYFQHMQLNKMHTEIHSRLALSTSCLFFVFLGGPYSISQAKKQFLTSFFLCFVPILLLYYPVALLMMTLSKSGDIDPSWAMWIPNVMLLFAGGYILRRVVMH